MHSFLVLILKSKYGIEPSVSVLLIPLVEVFQSCPCFLVRHHVPLPDKQCDTILVVSSTSIAYQNISAGITDFLVLAVTSSY